MEKLEEAQRIAVTIEGVNSQILRTLIGKFNSNTSTLEKEIGTLIESDPDKNQLIAWCHPSQKDQIQKKLIEKLDVIKNSLQNEVIEEVLVGGTRIVWGMGAKISHILFGSQFISLNIRKLALNVTEADIQKMVSKYAKVRQITLLPSQETQWANVVFYSPKDAEFSYNCLQGTHPK